MNHDLRQQSPSITYIFQRTDSPLCQRRACRCWLNIHVTSPGRSAASRDHIYVNALWACNFPISTFKSSAENCDLFLSQTPYINMSVSKNPSFGLRSRPLRYVSIPDICQKILLMRSSAAKRNSRIRPAGPKRENLSWNFAKDLWGAVVQIHKYTFISGAVTASLSF